MVAYLGADWEKFLPDIESVDRLVVQPNPPTNPKAIQDIVKKIGWKKVQFLDNLHAKVYIRLNEDGVSGKAIVGSPNLTANGLGGQGLYEAAVRFDFRATEDATQRGLMTSFDDVWNQACEKYGSKAAKEARLEKLIEDSMKYREFTGHIWQGNTLGTGRSIVEYGSEWNGDFWPFWWQKGDYDYTENVSAMIEKYGVEDEVQMANDDQIIARTMCGKWLLNWKLTDANQPHKTANIKWLYIHHTYINAVKDEDSYPGLVTEQKGRDKPKPPFQIDDGRTQQAIKKVLADKKYDSFRNEPEEGWKTQQIDSLMDDWLADVIAEYHSSAMKLPKAR